ncbi:MAG: SPOR domain-containing protein [Novosphingobium meiothermophilum]
MHGEGEDNDWNSKTVLQPGAMPPLDVADDLAEVRETAETAVVDAAAGRLALGDEDRLPWLESADDDEDTEADSGNLRLVGFAVLGLVVLAALIGGIWYASNRTAGPANADGSLIEASKTPYKVAPTDPGGKTFAGTGDSSFKVSQGEKPVANLAGSASPVPAAASSPAPKPGASSSASSLATAAAAPASAAGGVGVQVGAFSSSASAEAGWQKLVVNHEALNGLSHRVIEGKADIGTVYRLQAVAADPAAAEALCRRLQAGGLKCQVKR